MTVHSYFTIAGPAQGSYKEKGSKFLAFAFPVETEEEIRQRREELKKQYFDARHHCYAFIIGHDGKHYRAADDGEPNHSAGDPILGQIRSHNLTNTLIVVVRYFGGTKLGVGGLIQAYKEAAADALRQAVVVAREVKTHLTLQYAYETTPEIMKLVKEFELEIQEQQFDENCRITVAIRLRDEKQLHERLALLKALGHEVNYH